MKKVTLEELGEDLNRRIDKIKEDEARVIKKIEELAERERRVAYREENASRRERIIFGGIVNG